MSGLTPQVYGDLHGHAEHFHEAGDDPGWRRWRQTEVDIRWSFTFFPHRAKQSFQSANKCYPLNTNLMWLVDDDNKGSGKILKIGMGF